MLVARPRIVAAAGYLRPSGPKDGKMAAALFLKTPSKHGLVLVLERRNDNKVFPAS
jgi:hypothetical protein